jgi:preprotein translocase subunit SecE
LSKKVERIMDEAEKSEPQLPSPRAARFDDRVETKGRRAYAPSRAGYVGRLSQFIRDVRAEMKRVSWPTLLEVRNTTIITLVAVIFFATYLFAVDQAWARLINGLNWLLGKLFG